jgi:flagellar basal body-associated protein FliL
MMRPLPVLLNFSSRSEIWLLMTKLSNDTEIIIIIAIVVACLAFALLIFAVVWAWRSDRQSKGKQPTSVSGRSDSSNDNTGALKRTSQQQQQQYISTNNSKSGGKINGTQKPSGAPESSEESEVDVSAAASSNGRKSLFGRGNSKKAAKSEKNDTVSRIEPVVELPKNNANLLEQPAPENEGGGGDSVISDDINTSLTAYYRSGVTGYASGSRQRGYGDDAASLSSMDSYGYSLDGYAPSLGTAPHAGYPAGPLHAAGRAQIKVGDEDETQQEEVEDF